MYIYNDNEREKERDNQVKLTEFEKFMAKFQKLFM